MCVCVSHTKAPENCPNAKRRRRDTHSGADYHNATVKTTLIVTLPSSGHGKCAFLADYHNVTVETTLLITLPSSGHVFNSQSIITHLCFLFRHQFKIILHMQLVNRIIHDLKRNSISF